LLALKEADMKLKDKVVIVTGGGIGLGREIALAFAGEGANLVLAGRVQSKLDAVAREIGALGRKALAVKTDVTVQEQVYAMVKKTVAEFGRIDILVNNAGGPGDSFRTSLCDLDLKAWQKTLDTNVTGTFLCMRAVMPYMMERKSGVIINISSSMGKRGRAGMCAYSASKFAIEGLTQSAALEAYPFNIRINTLEPGNLTATPEMIKKHPGEDHTRWLQPDVIRKAAVYLASDESAGVTGQSLAATRYNMEAKDLKILMERSKGEVDRFKV